MNITPNRTGLTLGVTFAIYHSIWLLMVMSGLGTLVMTWIKDLHFITLSHGLVNFDLFKGLVGIIGAFLLGYAMGWIFGFIWQKTKSVK